MIVLGKTPQGLSNADSYNLLILYVFTFSNYSLASLLSIDVFAKSSLLPNCLTVFFGPLPLSFPVLSLFEQWSWIFGFHRAKVKKKKKKGKAGNLQMVAIFLFFQIMTTTIYLHPCIIKEAAHWGCVLRGAQLSLLFQFSAVSWAQHCGGHKRRNAHLPVLSGVP